jgi:hypothetical protein
LRSDNVQAAGSWVQVLRGFATDTIGGLPKAAREKSDSEPPPIACYDQKSHFEVRS